MLSEPITILVKSTKCHDPFMRTPSKAKSKPKSHFVYKYLKINKI